MTDFSKILDKAKELEAKMKESQEKIKNIKVEGVSGSNSVKVILDGEGEMQKIEISDEILNCKYSRIPIYKHEFNKLLGFLHKRQIIKMLIDGGITKEKIISTITPPYFIPEDTSLTSQLIEFKKERNIEL